MESRPTSAGWVLCQICEACPKEYFAAHCTLLSAYKRFHSAATAEGTGESDGNTGCEVATRRGAAEGGSTNFIDHSVET